MCSYGPFCDLMQTAGFIVATVTGLIILIWGKGLGSDLIPSSQIRLFKICVFVTMIVFLVISTLYHQEYDREYILYLLVIMLLVSLASIMLLLLFSHFDGNSILPFIVNFIAVIATSMTVILATYFFLGRLPLSCHPNSINLDEGSIGVLGSVKASRAKLSISGNVTWIDTDAGPSGESTYEWGVASDGGQKMKFDKTLNVPPNGQIPSSPVEVNAGMIIDIPRGMRNCGSSVPVIIKNTRCLRNTPRPTPAGVGQSSTCLADVIISISPVF